MRAALVLAALLLAAACQQDPPAQGARDASVPPLTVEGYGPLTIGMTLEAARTATRQPLNVSIDEDSAACTEQPFTTTDGDTLYLMFEQNLLTRISATDKGTHTRTAQNVGVGSTDAQVRTAYQGVIEQLAKYDDPPAHDLVVWTTPNQRGLRFEVNDAGTVWAVHAGGPSIQYVEGCS